MSLGFLNGQHGFYKLERQKLPLGLSQVCAAHFDDDIAMLPTHSLAFNCAEGSEGYRWKFGVICVTLDHVTTSSWDAVLQPKLVMTRYLSRRTSLIFTLYEALGKY